MIPYLFISGFLGAGKTTLLNNLLNRYAHLKIGVIVNDFGELAVDNTLINKEGVAGEILELRAGQIFCSCLSGRFIESVLAYDTISPDLLLVECSGLAKPATLSDIVQVIDSKAPDRFDYAGMIALIDGTSYTVLEQSLLVISEQIEAGDMLLISKTDQLEQCQYQDLKTHLEERYPDKTILTVPKDRIDHDLVEMLKTKQKAFSNMDNAKHAGWGERGRPKTFTLIPGPMQMKEIVDTLQPFQGRWYRLKGTLKTADNGLRYFDGVQGNVKVKESTGAEELGLVVITHDSQLEKVLKEAFGIKPVLQPVTLPQHNPNIS